MPCFRGWAAAVPLWVYATRCRRSAARTGDVTMSINRRGCRLWLHDAVRRVLIRFVSQFVRQPTAAAPLPAHPAQIPARRLLFCRLFPQRESAFISHMLAENRNVKGTAQFAFNISDSAETSAKYFLPKN